MITAEDKKIILDFTKKITPKILKDINFDPTVKEVGHSFGDRFEDEFVKELKIFDSNFTEPTDTRSMDDVKFKGNYINIKFGYQKNGQPNICSMKRLFNSLHENKIDSYYILSIDADGPTFQFFDVYDYLDYTNFNYGTGQLMLCESKMKQTYTFNESFDLTKEQKIYKMGKMMKEECVRHIRLKQSQQDKIDRIVNEYQNTLSELCTA